jgi:hypothetical protein
MKALILVAERGGPTMLARIGVMQALNRHEVREFTSDRKPITGESASWRGMNSPIALQDSRIAAGESLRGRAVRHWHGGKPNREGRQAARGTISLASD